MVMDGIEVRPEALDIYSQAVEQHVPVLSLTPSTAPLAKVSHCCTVTLLQ